ncbi:sporulation protein YunB [Clostridium ihumii]|uniref:sporulation protein YunB n=1 Tax=Clostridium ihumii TaxID=1470356 RepID=UPI000688AB3B|nr:sporulation protein YunB [Clostridium ihumii]
MKKGKKIKLISIIIFILTVLMAFMYYFDEIILPTILVICDGEMRAKSVNLINETIIEKYIDNFNYEEIVKFDKDEKGNIVLLKADTLKMNKIATELSLDIQDKLKNLEDEEIEFPIGYITKNNLLSNFGPRIKAKMQPIGYVESKYISDFESAGINQTRHKIYVEVTATVKVILPTTSNDVKVVTQVPIAETIIVGKIPESSIVDLNAK